MTNAVGAEARTRARSEGLLPSGSYQATLTCFASCPRSCSRAKRLQARQRALYGVTK